MGSPPVPPGRAADFVLASLLQRKRVALMGRANRLIAFVKRLSPRAADLFRLRRAGRLLRDAFSSKTPGPPD